MGSKTGGCLPLQIDYFSSLWTSWSMQGFIFTPKRKRQEKEREQLKGNNFFFFFFNRHHFKSDSYNDILQLSLSDERNGGEGGGGGGGIGRFSFPCPSIFMNDYALNYPRLI